VEEFLKPPRGFHYLLATDVVLWSATGCVNISEHRIQYTRRGGSVEEIVIITSCILSVLTSVVLGRRYAEELIEPLKGLGVVASVVGAIAAITSLLGSVNVHTWAMPTTISSTDQFAQYIFNSVQIPLAFVWGLLLNMLASMPLGLATYIATYIVASLREQVTRYTVF